jgi:hypothetical protein
MDPWIDGKIYNLIKFNVQFEFDGIKLRFKKRYPVFIRALKDLLRLNIIFVR